MRKIIIICKIRPVISKIRAIIYVQSKKDKKVLRKQLKKAGAKKAKVKINK